MHVSTTTEQPLEIRKAAFIANDRLAVDQAYGDSKRAQRPDNERESFGPVVPIAGEKPHSRGAPPRGQVESAQKGRLRKSWKVLEDDEDVIALPMDL
jgi:hypothetical protein